MLDIKKFMRGIKLFNNATQASSVNLNVPDTYTGNYTFEFPSTGATSGQEIVTSGSTQTLDDKTLTNVDISTSEHIQLPIESSDPSGTEGDVIYNSTAQSVKFYNSGGWQTVGSSASANQTLSNLLSPTAINQNLLPSGSRDIGASGNRFTNIYSTSSDLTSSTIGTASITGTATIANLVPTNITNITSSANLPIIAPSILWGIGNTSNPGSPVEQQMYYNTSEHVFKYYTGTTWVGIATSTDIGAKANDNLNNLTPTSINQSLDPAGTAIYNMGTSADTWLNIWAKRHAISNGSSDIGGISNTNINTLPLGLGLAGTSGFSLEYISDGTSNKPLTIFTTNSNSGTTKALYLLTGDLSSGSGHTGAITIGTGNHLTATSGDINIKTGNSTSGTDGGSISLVTGTAINGGDITLDTTNSGNTTNGGNIFIQTGVNSLNTSGYVAIGGRFLQIPIRSTANGDPTSPEPGAMFFRNTDNILRIYNGSSWRSITTT